MRTENGLDFQSHFLEVMQNLEHHVNALALVADSAEQLFGRYSGCCHKKYVHVHSFDPTYTITPVILQPQWALNEIYRLF